MLAVLSFGVLMTDIDMTVLNIALPTLVRDLHTSTAQLQWIVDVYSLVFGGLLLTTGSIADRVGRKWVLLIGFAVFGVGSAGSAYAGGSTELIVARAAMGLGGSMIMPATLSITTNVFHDPRERAKAIGIWSGSAGLGVAAGPLLGGWLLAHFWWGSVFLINLPVAALSLLAAVWLVPDSRDPSAPRPDVIGSVLSIVGLGVLLWGIIEAPVEGWGSATTIGAMSCGIVALAAFAIVEIRSDHPMLPLSFFRNRSFSAPIASVFLVLFALSGALFMFTQYIQFVLGYSAFRTGIFIAPVSLVLFVFSPVATVVVHRFGARLVIPAGLAVVAIGLWTSTGLHAHFSYAQMVWRFMLVGAGVGVVMAPATNMVLGAVPKERAGVGSATNSAMIQVGGALGVAVLGSILSTRYQGRMGSVIAGYKMPDVARHAILSSVGGALVVAQKVGGEVGATLTRIADSSYTSGMALALLVGTFFTIAGVLVAAAFLPSGPQHPAPEAEEREPASVG